VTRFLERPFRWVKWPHIMPDFGASIRILAACRSRRRRAILRTDEHQVTPSDVWRPGQDLRAMPRRPARKPKSSPARPGTSACSVLAGRPSPRRRSVMHSIRLRFPRGALLGCETHQTVALDVIRRPKASPSTSSSATCAARTARRCAAIRVSAATWSRRVPPRFRRAILRRSGGRGTLTITRPPRLGNPPLPRVSVSDIATHRRPCGA
jgi:hypothetical protein